MDSTVHCLQCTVYSMYTKEDLLYRVPRFNQSVKVTDHISPSLHTPHPPTSCVGVEGKGGRGPIGQ